MNKPLIGAIMVSISGTCSSSSNDIVPCPLSKHHHNHQLAQLEHTNILEADHIAKESLIGSLCTSFILYPCNHSYYIKILYQQRDSGTSFHISNNFYLTIGFHISNDKNRNLFHHFLKGSHHVFKYFIVSFTTCMQTNPFEVHP